MHLAYYATPNYMLIQDEGSVMRRVTLPMAIVFPYLLLACSRGDLLESAGPCLEACSVVKVSITHYLT